jgi:valyl-tRNA synthetase
MYEFFWFDFADWYIEASKARLYANDGAARAVARNTLVYVLDRALRLWHPFMPFITEQLWGALPHAGADALMLAAWPEGGGARSLDAEAHFEIVRRVVGTVRNARAEYDVPLGRRVQAIVAVEDGGLRGVLESEAAALCLLAKVELDTVQVRNANENAAASAASL